MKKQQAESKKIKILLNVCLRKIEEKKKGIKMKKIITAIGNPTLNQVLKKEEAFKIVAEDISYQEGILEVLEKETEVDFIILSELLPGELEVKELIEKIKKANSQIQIILFLENKKEELENYLYAKGLFAIFYHNQVEIKDIITILKDKEKNQNSELKKELEELKRVLREKEKVETKKNSFFQKRRHQGEAKINNPFYFLDKSKQQLEKGKLQNQRKIISNQKKEKRKKKECLKETKGLPFKEVICISRN